MSAANSDLTLNPRVESLAGSATAAIFEKAKALKAQGKDIISMAVGEPDFGPPQVAREAVAESMQLKLFKYTSVPGTATLVESIVKNLKETVGLNYTAPQIVVSNGAKHSLSLAMTAMIRPGDEVVIPAPYWVSYPEMVKLNGGVPVVIRTKSSNGWILSAQELEAVISPKTRLVIITNPSNPTGSVLSQKNLDALAAVLRKYPHVYVISDDIYNGMVLDGSDMYAKTFASQDGFLDRTITINGMSKLYAMTGLRIGYMAAPLKIAKACGKLQSQTSGCPCSVSQHASEAAFKRTPSSYYEENNGSLRAKRDCVMKVLGQIPNLICETPKGAFYAYPDVSAFFGMKTKEGTVIKDSSDICLELLSHGLALVPGIAFGEPLGIRIAYATDMDKVMEGMERLRGFFLSLSSD